jgi:glycosyltransferase involved in cell wall biosynthesis
MANVLEPMQSMLKRRLKALKDYTYITFSMQSRKTFLLATNDGSRADQLYDILGIKSKKFRFFFWTSGVAVPEKQPIVDFETRGNYPQTYDPMALSMVNRIADVKRQDRAVQILGELHRRGYPFHLYFIGDVSSQAMLDATNKAIEEYGVADYVHFEGGKSQNECRQYARNSFATLLPCEWNRVNVFYEVMGEGAVVVTNDNHSIDEFIEPDANCLLYEEDNFAQAAEAARRSGVRQLWLAHYSQMVEDPKACLPNVTAVFEGAVCGEDGMSMTLRFED